jgi:hypothetical protein
MDSLRQMRSDMGGITRADMKQNVRLVWLWVGVSLAMILIYFGLLWLFHALGGVMQ